MPHFSTYKLDSSNQIQVLFSYYYVLFKSDGCNDQTVGSASWLQTENEGGFIPHFIKTPEPQQATLKLLIFEDI